MRAEIQAIFRSLCNIGFSFWQLNVIHYSIYTGAYPPNYDSDHVRMAFHDSDRHWNIGYQRTLFYL